MYKDQDDDSSFFIKRQKALFSVSVGILLTFLKKRWNDSVISLRLEDWIHKTSLNHNFLLKCLGVWNQKSEHSYFKIIDLTLFLRFSDDMRTVLTVLYFFLKFIVFVHRNSKLWLLNSGSKGIGKTLKL
jgi:hypothetical protein